MKRFVVGLVILVAALGLLTGCFSSSNSSSSNGSDATASVRVLHAVADAPPVDIYVLGDVAVENLAFGEATPFAPVPVGQLAIDVRASGADPDSEPAISETVVPERGGFYTIVAYGRLDDGSLELLVIDDIQDQPADGQVRLFVLHGAPAVGEVDVYLGTDSGLGAAALTGFAPQETTDGYLEVPAGEYRIRITPADSETVAYDSGIVALQAGLSYFVAALDRESGFAPASTVALLDDPAFIALEDQRSRVRAMHLSPDAPAVDVLVNGGVVLEDFAFRQISDYLTVLAGSYTVAVAATGSITPVDQLDADLEPGVAYSVLATGLLADEGESGFALRPIVDQTARDPASALLRVIHASPDAPAVDVLLGDDVIEGLAEVSYFAVSGYLSVPGGTYDFFVNVAGTETTVLDLSGTELENGNIVTVIAVDTVENIDVIVVED
ncbi:MAG: DUF4397 domain-containing protein [Ectothiorhodospiraceae bacterium]|nr:DUF4397 domain-containing protein [Ectothiorhodospiraceae bacterium]